MRTSTFHNRRRSHLDAVIATTARDGNLILQLMNEMKEIESNTTLAKRAKNRKEKQLRLRDGLQVR